MRINVNGFTVCAVMAAGFASSAQANGDEWIGGYGGIAAAYTSTSTGFSGEEPRGFSGAGILGANLFSIQNVVIGVEGAVALFGKVDEGGSEAKDAWSLAGRLGYSAGKFMPYVGVGYGRGKGEYNGENAYFSGVVFGGGLETRLTDSINVRAEYMRFQSTSNKTLGGQSIDPDADVFRIGVTSKF